MLAAGRARYALRGSARAWLVAIALLCTACSHVHPYEREYHSKPHMTPGDERAETAFQAHLRESREGATSGSSAAGGGCGCN